MYFSTLAFIFFAKYPQKAVAILTIQKENPFVLKCLEYLLLLHHYVSRALHLSSGWPQISQTFNSCTLFRFKLLVKVIKAFVGFRV